MVAGPKTMARAGLRWFFVVAGLALVRIPVRSQELRVTAQADSNNIVIGDWLDVHFEIRHPAGTSVRIAGWADTLAGLEILRRDSVRQTAGAQELLEQFKLTMTSYDSGTFVIPPLRVFMPAGTGGDSIRAESSPIAVFVHSVGADTSKEIKDIKQPVNPGISFAEILPYFIGVVVVGGIVWLALYVMKKRKKGERLIPAAPPRPPQELALEALRALEAEHLWQRGLVKQYHSALSDIVRIYLERRTDVRAMELVTDEILSHESIASLGSEVTLALKVLLSLADLVKFAKYTPLPEEHERSMQSAIFLVEETSGSKVEARAQEALREQGT
jgi:hypothetical protein